MAKPTEFFRKSPESRALIPPVAYVLWVVKQHSCKSTTDFTKKAIENCYYIWMELFNALLTAVR